VTQAPELRSRADALSANLPPLLAAAHRLAATINLGDHGRRRAGMGDEFWQYRTAANGDDARAIDWRRSARSDTAFVQEKEWQIAHSVMLWVDTAASMGFASSDNLPTKMDRAQTLGLATAILLLKAGERVGLPGLQLAPKRGLPQADAIAMSLLQNADTDYGAPVDQGLLPHSRAVYLSDFLGDLDGVRRSLDHAAQNNVHGVMIQVLDPQERDFPFQGRTVFNSLGGSLTFETQRAQSLASDYAERLASRQAELHALADAAGWQFTIHHTDQSAQSALLWMYSALKAALV
jgi:uncharacterized protein (DUF58 family)